MELGHALHIVNRYSLSRCFCHQDGVVDALVTLLKAASSTERVTYGHKLYNTAWGVESARAPIASSGCLEIFLQMMRGGTVEEKDVAAGALAAVCKSHEVAMRVPHAELMQLCTDMLLVTEDESCDSRNAALRLITSFAADPVVGQDTASHSLKLS